MTATEGLRIAPDGRKEPLLRASRPSFPPRRTPYGRWTEHMVPRPVVALDIDGTLGQYHEHFLQFAEGWLGRSLPSVNDYEGDGLASFIHVNKARYREIKLAYRQGGLKRSMPVYPGAALLARDLRIAGAEVWIATTRPYLRLDNIDPDTREWLRRNRIQWDAVIYGERKYRDLAKLVPDRSAVIGVLDDLVEMALQAEHYGMPAYLRSQPYNAWRGLEHGIPVLVSLDFARAMFRQLIQGYKESNGISANSR